jgi:hypothetical protein
MSSPPHQHRTPATALRIPAGGRTAAEWPAGLVTVARTPAPCPAYPGVGGGWPGVRAPARGRATCRDLSLYLVRWARAMLGAAVDTVGGVLMAVYVLLAAALVSLSGVLMLVAGRRGWFRDRRRHRFPRASPREGATRARVPFSRRVGVGHAEAALTARLFAGKLDSADYRQAMAELAADDSVRHPVVVPRDRGGLDRARRSAQRRQPSIQRGPSRIGSGLSTAQSIGDESDL